MGAGAAVGTASGPVGDTGAVETASVGAPVSPRRQLLHLSADDWRCLGSARPALDAQGLEGRRVEAVPRRVVRAREQSARPAAHSQLYHENACGRCLCPVFVKFRCS